MNERALTIVYALTWLLLPAIVLAALEAVVVADVVGGHFGKPKLSVLYALIVGSTAIAWLAACLFDAR